MESVLLAFSRSVIGIVFLLSVVGKLRNVAEFQTAIRRFRILPDKYVGPSALLFLGGELMVVVLVFLGGKTILGLGFVLAALLLTVFSGALISVLMRNIQAPCNCFGSKETLISPYDVGRNVVFVLFALGGLLFYSNASINAAKLNLLELSLIGLTALVFVLVVINVSEIVQIFKKPF